MAEKKNTTNLPSKIGEKNPKISSSDSSKFGPRRQSGGQSSQQHQGRGRDERNQSRNYQARRRPPPKVSRRINDVYIGEGSSFQAQYVKCQQLLDGGQKEVFLHGIGDAIPRALNLAAKLRDQYKGSLDFSVTTSTVKLIDDLIPTNDSTPPSQNYRTQSAVNVKLFRTVDLP